jgi:hypothetical protein
MNNDLLARWTAITTNIAVVIGLVFVGLEFQNNSRLIEAERIEGYSNRVAEIQALWVGKDNLADILYKSHAKPDELSVSDLNRLQHLLYLYQNNFTRIYQAHQAGLVPDDVYATEKSSIGFTFSSDIGLDLIELMQQSELGELSWSEVKDSAIKARAYCLNPKHKCAAMYEEVRNKNP